ncbi:myoD family inhibitor domain-containing protein isoform X1 [Archocentrus centrarchus]|uniref:myoD family inhibitor domain-containing protein isoform X1 n=1 Tax=Archocentrus centrarchus TaxID=63155 RepID=UPI0011EA3B27|nr:myoD family inhibitor domain-containing protein-like isoform X1 [Archocentrus centrarchus]
MDVTSHGAASSVTEDTEKKDSHQSECIVTQPTANGTLPYHSTDEAPPPASHKSDADSSDDSLTDSSSTNDISRLLPTQPSSALRKQKGVDSSSSSSSSSSSPPPVCTPPSSSCTSPPPPASRSSTSRQHQHQSTKQKRLSSTKSHASLKTDAAHIKEVAGDDCCAHCLLACLFCEVLSMCSAVGDCLVCGMGGVGCCDAVAGGGGCCCCCMEAAGEAACTEEACQAVLDCGIIENCCGSSDCLEICLECCSICFPA